MVETKLEPCPFCGGEAEMQPWHGGGPDKQLVGCMDADGTCVARPSVTGETPAEAITAWNTRSQPLPTGEVGELDPTKARQAIAADMRRQGHARMLLTVTETGYSASFDDGIPTALQSRSDAADKLVEALRPFASAARIQHPDSEQWPDDKPSREFLPGVWPDWGDFRRASEALTEYEGAR